MTHPSRPCPVCRSAEKKLLHRQSFSGFSTGTFLHEYDVCACSSCGFLYADRLPSEEAFDTYYAEMSKWEFLDNGGRESAEDQARFAATVQAIESLAGDRSARVLDVGCATGGMLATLKRAGYRNLLGLDPSPQAARLANKNYGIEVSTGDVKAIPRLPGKFEVITILGVLEHIPDPRRTLRDLRAALAPQGLLYVSVPDATRFAEYMDSPYQQYSTEHIMYFTPASLDNLVGSCGFERVSFREMDSFYTRTYRYPAFDIAYRVAPERAPVYDATGPRAADAYLEASRHLDTGMAAEIDRLVESGEPVIVWGVGTMTQRLMQRTRLPQAKIVAFVDSNPHYQGKDLKGVPIIGPQEVPTRKEPILIGSLIFETEIREQIRERLRCENRIVTLRPAA